MEDPRFEDLYRSEGPSVLATVYLLCRDQTIAEEATQEAFVRALERWGRLAEKPWAAGWVVTTALNVARRAMRRIVPNRPEQQDPDLEGALDLWAEVLFLPLRQQQAVILRYRLDMEVADIAKAMRCREGTVRTHLGRAHQALRRRLEGAVDADR